MIQIWLTLEWSVQTVHYTKLWIQQVIIHMVQKCAKISKNENDPDENTRPWKITEHTFSVLYSTKQDT